MYVYPTIEEVTTGRKQLQGTVALVPTMGNLHEGHLTLVREAIQLADNVIATIFVNPMQFGPNEDLDSYPRTLERDLELLKREGVSIVFTPSNTEIYPEGVERHTQVFVPEITTDYCGANRPGHFTGVSTIVLKLFNITNPDIAVFGKKDYQQLAVIRKMVTDLAVPIEIVGLDTVREHSGLAMSSRNQYLTPTERTQATALSQTLSWAKSEVLSGQQSFDNIENQAIANLGEVGFNMEYFTIADQTNLKVADENTAELVILAAGKLGSTRLIDNIDFSK